ncbi:hypothetical protein BDP27DRAFT_902549 [Rhodocollybia butyracea]|uniref:Uncharacterized protein n=1 Tax=Rhodocollybia butyracea TaxID=206335 RepID=A0A9P5P5P3_9AGAR|nr:hypothetical protein BDP27DRAFT_902549 [Rhodocollybia butyracea]
MWSCQCVLLFVSVLSGLNDSLSLRQDSVSSDAEKHLRYFQMCNERLTSLEEAIERCFQPRTEAEQLSQDAGQWPRLTVRTLLWQLSVKLRKSYSEKWRTAFAELACRLIHLHRARRLIELQRSHSPHYSPEVEATPFRLLRQVKIPIGF